MINRLSRKQARQVEEFFERWTAFEPPPHGLEMDSALMRSAVHFMHTIGVKGFEVILFDSPHKAFKTFDALLLDSETAHRRSYDPMRSYSNLLGSLHEHFEVNFIVGVDPKIRAGVSDRIHSLPVFARMREVVAATDFEVLQSDFRSRNSGYRVAFTDVLADRSLVRTLLGAAVAAPLTDDRPEAALKFEGLLHLIALSPCILLYQKKLFVSRPPVEVCRDHSGRINATDRPAITYADGEQASSIEGVSVKNEIFDPDFEITALMILEEGNMEVRRVLMDRYGIEPFLKELKAEVVSVDDYGTLYSAEYERRGLKSFLNPDEKSVRFVRLLNSTPELGTTDEFKEYLLRVPPTTLTPRAAVAWSFGLEEGEYAPEVES